MTESTNITASNQQQEEATSLYNLTTEDEVFATETEVALLRESGDLAQDIVAKEKSSSVASKHYDSSYMYHRSVKFGTEDRLKWVKRLPKDLKEQYEEEEINDSDPNQHFVAVRGIPLEWHYGFRLYDNDKQRNACRTITLVEHREGLVDRVTNEDAPLRIPVQKPYWSKSKPDQVNWVLERNPQLDLLALRTVESDSVSNDGKSNKAVSYETVRCRECVANQEYTVGANSCGTQGFLLFAVFEVGIKDPSKHNQDPINNPVAVKWVDVKDAGLTAWNGEPLTHPFIIRLEGLGASQMKKIGFGEYDLPVILPSHMKEKGRKTCYLPTDAELYSAGDFYDWLNDPNAVDGRNSVSKQGNRLFTTYSEIYITGLARKTATKNFIPVFNPIATGKKTLYKDIPIADYVKTALKVLGSERAEATALLNSNRPNNNSDNGSASNSGSSKTPSPTPLSPTKESDPELTPAETKLRKAALSAFNVPE